MTGAEPAPTNEPVEAYEEDWYRSLRALAERQQLGGPDAEELSEEAEASPEAAEGLDEQAAQAVAEADGQAEETRGRHGEAEPAEAVVALIELVEAPGSETVEAGNEEIGAEPAEEPEELAPAARGEPAALEELSPEADAGAEERGREHEPEPSVGGRPPVEAATPAGAEEPAAAPSEEALAAEELEPVAFEEPQEPAGPSLTSTDPQERRRALDGLATGDLSDSDVERVTVLLFDPDAEIRRTALQTLARRPERVDDTTVLQALQDPADEVRAAAVELAVSRGATALAQLVPLLAARSWPLTHETVLRHLPGMVAATSVDDELLERVLDAVGEMDPGPGEDERPVLSKMATALGTKRIVDRLASSDVRRLGAVRLLAEDRSPEVLRALASQGGDQLEEIRNVAAAAIADLAEAQAQTSGAEPGPLEASQSTEGTGRIASLARALMDDDATVRHLALSGLAGMERAAIVSWVHDTIRSGDASQLALAASTAQVLRLVEGAADILDAAAELSADARRNLVGALTSFVMPPDQLAGLLPQVRDAVRAEAIRMLWHVGGAPLLPHLRPYLGDDAAMVRTAVLDVYGESGDPTAADVAREVLETDVSAEVRARAVRVLAKASGVPPVATVVRALSDPDPTVRAIAIESLPDAEDQEAVDVLVSSLSDPDDRVRKAAAKRLASRGDDPEIVWSALQLAPAAGRGEIIGAFEDARPGSLTQVALRRLRSPDQDERVLAVEVAGWGASPGSVEGAIQALQDPAAPVRRAAAASLARLRDAAAAKALGKALGDPDPEVRVGVVRALGVIDDEAVLGFLVSALNDPDSRVRDVASHVLTEWSSPAVARRLAGVLAVPSLREAATDLLTRIGTPAVELLIEVLMQHNQAVVPTVGQLLQQISDPSEFVSRLEAVEPERRLRGVEALGAIGGRAAADALLRSVSDPDERIRVRAAQLLTDLRDPRAREVLATLARDPVPGVVAAAQEALARLGEGGDRAA